MLQTGSHGVSVQLLQGVVQAWQTTILVPRKTWSLSLILRPLYTTSFPLALERCFVKKNMWLIVYTFILCFCVYIFNVQCTRSNMDTNGTEECIFRGFEMHAIEREKVSFLEKCPRFDGMSALCIDVDECVFAGVLRGIPATWPQPRTLRWTRFGPEPML